MTDAKNEDQSGSGIHDVTDARARADYPARSRYVGEAAARYDEDRAHDAKWAREIAFVGAYVSNLPADATLLDVPVGTGRFLPEYGDREVVGVDVSRDMLTLAGERAAQVGARVTLHHGEIERLPLPDGAVDHAICMRLANWLPLPVFRQAIRELARVTRHGVLVQVRVRAAASAPDSSWVRARRAAATLLTAPLKALSSGSGDGYELRTLTDVHDAARAAGMRVTAEHTLDDRGLTVFELSHEPRGAPA